jgi:hypothetical protein
LQASNTRPILLANMVDWALVGKIIGAFGRKSLWPLFLTTLVIVLLPMAWLKAIGLDALWEEGTRTVIGVLWVGSGSTLGFLAISERLTAKKALRAAQASEQRALKAAEEERNQVEAQEQAGRDHVVGIIRASSFSERLFMLTAFDNAGIMQVEAEHVEGWQVVSLLQAKQMVTNHSLIAREFGPLASIIKMTPDMYRFYKTFAEEEREALQNEAHQNQMDAAAEWEQQMKDALRKGVKGVGAKKAERAERAERANKARRGELPPANDDDPEGK